MPVQSAPITLQEAEGVWKSQARPSARSVARALTQAGRPVHFTTVARWKRQGLLTIARTSESAEPEASPENLFAELPPPVPKRVGPFILQPLRGGKGGSGKWKLGSSTHSRQR